MLTYLRYALATFCFAASVGCLALWGWTESSAVVHQACYDLGTKTIILESNDGRAIVLIARSHPVPRQQGWHLKTFDPAGDYWKALGVDEAMFWVPELFGTLPLGYYFPLWYPALIFALAGVAALRLGRFTLRSAIIAMTVVAGLLGMAVVL